MTTTADNITDSQIRKLRKEAESAGDLLMAMICVRALGDDMEDAEDGTDGAEAREMTVEQARAECARVCADAEAQRGDDDEWGY